MAGKVDMTADELEEYLREHGAYPPVPGRPEAWVERCTWCDGPAICDDDAPDRGRVYCSSGCRVHDDAHRMRMGYR